MSLDQLVANYNFEKLHTTSQIKYDIEKLKWINHKWIVKTDINRLIELCKPFLEKEYDLSAITAETLKCLISIIQTDLHKLSDAPEMLRFYFSASSSNNEKLESLISKEKIEKLRKILKQNLTLGKISSITQKKKLKSLKYQTKNYFHQFELY